MGGWLGQHGGWAGSGVVENVGALGWTDMGNRVDETEEGWTGWVQQSGLPGNRSGQTADN